jgi:hypothetical protein
VRPIAHGQKPGPVFSNGIGGQIEGLEGLEFGLGEVIASIIANQVMIYVTMIIYPGTKWSNGRDQN